jgi:nucleoside-diphosphate-sugar epimerase
MMSERESAGPSRGTGATPEPTSGFAAGGLAFNGDRVRGEATAGSGVVVVTGVCGFIGSNLAAELLRRGRSVVGVDRRPPETATPIAGLLPRLRRHRGFWLLTANADDREVIRLLDGVSAVVHLAAATDVAASWEAGFADHAASVLSTQRLLHACGQAGVPRVVVASSCHVYGPTGDKPARENALVEPSSPWVAKLATERLAVAYARRPDTPMSAVALRYFTAFGPGCNPAMVVPRMFRAALTGEPMPLYGDGTARHSWTHVADLVDATIRAVQVPLEAGCAQVVNAAGPGTASLRQVADLVGQIVGRPVTLRAAGERAGDAAGTRADLTRARRVLGFTPRVGLRDGLLRQWQTMTADRHPHPAGPDPAARDVTARS